MPVVEMYTENKGFPFIDRELAASIGKDPNGDNYVCPVDSDGDNTWITLNGRTGPASATSPIQFAPITDGGAQTKYVITTYDYVMEKCGYIQIRFRWSGGDYILPTIATYYLPVKTP